VTSERDARGFYRVTPTEPLAPGEYGFVVRGHPGLHRRHEWQDFRLRAGSEIAHRGLCPPERHQPGDGPRGARPTRPARVQSGAARDGWESTCRDLLGLTKMDWNNGGFYDRLPVTMSYARVLARTIQRILELAPRPYELRFFV
jgi:hypothetical protein